jgi:hypothetical protein
LLYNQLKQKEMKNQIALGIMKVWAASLTIIAVGGITYAIVCLCIGKYSSTAAFEF